ncbi:MAG: HAD family hydrolase [Acidimicrobiales bacterium]
MGIALLGFDADDTLWHSENHFAVTEERFRDLLAPWVDGDTLAGQLLQRERTNLEIFGYGAKGFTLSMMETAIEVSGGAVPARALQEIIGWGKELLHHPVDLIEGVVETLDRLGDRYRMVLITKGDLFHQESKIAESGLAERFERVEVLSEKNPVGYRRVLDTVGTPAEEFLMVGNSVPSDILPVLEIGGQAVHVPYGLTWAHEEHDAGPGQVPWRQIPALADLPALLDEL